MTKKEYLIKLLTALEGKWPMAAGLKLLIENNTLDDQVVAGLQHVFAEAINSINDEKAIESLNNSQKFLQKLREKELQEQTKDDELNQLLADI